MNIKKEASVLSAGLPDPSDNADADEAEAAEVVSAAASFTAHSLLISVEPGISDANGTIFETSVSTGGTAVGVPGVLLTVSSFVGINSSDTDYTSICIFLNHISFCRKIQ